MPGRRPLIDWGGIRLQSLKNFSDFRNLLLLPTLWDLWEDITCLEISLFFSEQYETGNIQFKRLQHIWKLDLRYIPFQELSEGYVLCPVIWIVAKKLWKQTIIILCLVQILISTLWDVPVGAFSVTHAMQRTNVYDTRLESRNCLCLSMSTLDIC